METTTTSTSTIYSETLLNILGAVILNGTATYTKGGTRITGGSFDADTGIVELRGDRGRLIHSGAQGRRIEVEVVIW